MNGAFIISGLIYFALMAFLLYETVTYARKRKKDDPLLSDRQIVLVILMPLSVIIFNI